MWNQVFYHFLLERTSDKVLLSWYIFKRKHWWVLDVHLNNAKLHIEGDILHRRFFPIDRLKEFLETIVFVWLQLCECHLRLTLTVECVSRCALSQHTSAIYVPFVISQRNIEELGLLDYSKNHNQDCFDQRQHHNKCPRKSAIKHFSFKEFPWTLISS